MGVEPPVGIEKPPGYLMHISSELYQQEQERIEAEMAKRDQAPNENRSTQ